jgi:glycosyltransferase involved in cell wall biosynthesis
VADFFYPDTVGGSAIVAYEIMKELQGRGHRVSVLTRLQDGLAEKEEVSGLHIQRYAMPNNQKWYPLGVLRATQSLREMVRKNDFDVVNIHHASGGVAVEWSTKVPSVFFFHGPWHKEAMAKNGVEADAVANNKYDRSLQYRLRKIIDSRILHHCNAFVTLSDYMLHEALALGRVNANKHVRILGGVDIDRFRPATDKAALRRELKLPTGKILLLTVRRLTARMGLENLVEAMAIVEKEREDVQLIIGGRGELEDKLKKQINRLGLQRTTLEGFIGESDLPKYYQASDLFIMPSSTMEGFGLSTIEAMACGTPVLGTPVGGTREILEKEFPEFLFSGVTPFDLARGILGKIDVAQDTATKTKVREYAESHSWSRVTDQFEALLISVVAGN